MVSEVLGIDLVKQGEILHVLQIAGGLDHVIERKPRGLQDGGQVFQGLNGLGSQAVSQSARIGNDSQLAGGKDESTGLNCLGLGADGGGSFVSVQNFHAGTSFLYKK